MGDTSQCGRGLHFLQPGSQKPDSIHGKAVERRRRIQMDKGKPAERRGRKATGLLPEVRVRFAMKEELP